MLKRFNEVVDLRKRALMKNVLGDFEDTIAVIGEVGDKSSPDEVYSITREHIVPVPELRDLITYPDDGIELVHSAKVDDTTSYNGRVKITIGMGVITIESSSEYKVKVSKGVEVTKTSYKHKLNVTLLSKFKPAGTDISTFYYKVVFNKIKMAPVVVISRNPNFDLEAIITDNPTSLFNSIYDASMEVDTKLIKQIFQSDNIKTRNFNYIFDEIESVYECDSIDIQDDIIISDNVIGITETTTDNSSLVEYRPVFHEEGDDKFILDKWSRTPVENEDNLVKVNVYRLSESVIDKRTGHPVQDPTPDPNYTISRLYGEAVNDPAIKNTARVIGHILKDYGFTENEVEFKVYDREENPNDGVFMDRFVLIPFDVINNPCLIQYQSSIPMEELPDGTFNYLSIFAESFYNKSNMNCPSTWIILSYQDSITNKHTIKKILVETSAWLDDIKDNICYVDTIEEQYDINMRQDIHTIEFPASNYKFRFANHYTTDITGLNVKAHTFIYESPELEFTNKNGHIDDFVSSIYSKKDDVIYIRSEYGCLTPYKMPK